MMELPKEKRTIREKSLIVVHSQGEKVQVKEKITQKSAVLAAFSGEPKTMLMVEVEIGVRRTNFTSLLYRMVEQGSIYKVKFSKCPLSGRNGVGFYSTNKKYKPKTNQLTLFSDAA